MATIFQEADNVITWLGPATSGSDQILNFLKTVDVSSLGDRFWARSFLRPYYCDGMTGAPRFSPEFLDSLDCEYWSRLWVVQEIAVASAIRVFWGNESLDGAVLESLFSQVLWNRVRTEIGGWIWTSVRSFRHMVNIWSVRHLRRTRPPMDLLSLLLQLSRGKTTETLDRVYAIVGLAFDQGALIAEPDYTLKPDQLCFLATRRFIRTAGSLDIILIHTFAPSIFRNPWTTWTCPLFHFDDINTREVAARSLVEYIYGRRRKLRCGSSGKIWNAANSSLITNDTAIMECKVLSVVGLRLGVINRPFQSEHDTASFCDRQSDSQLLETFDSLGRMLMIYSHLYERTHVRSILIRLLENINIQKYRSSGRVWDPYIFEFQRKVEKSLVMKSYSPSWVQELLKRTKAKVDAEGVLIPSAEDMQHATEAALEVIAEFPYFFLFESECFGITTRRTLPLDGELWLLTGCSMPVVLVPAESHEDPARLIYIIHSHIVVDSANIQGKRCRVMDGEAWRNANEEDFQWINIQ